MYKSNLMRTNVYVGKWQPKQNLAQQLQPPFVQDAGFILNNGITLLWPMVLKVHFPPYRPNFQLRTWFEAFLSGMLCKT